MQGKNQPAPTEHYTNSISNSYNEEARALDVVAVNSLVPVRFGKVELEYITSGNGQGEVGRADYYSNGVYQETQITTIGDSAGSAHKTTLNFINRAAPTLGGQGFIVYDNTGPVLIWFNVDFTNSEPDSIAYRSIEVNLFSTHDPETVASKVAQKIDLDSQFLAISTMTYTIISSVSAGIKENSFDMNTGVYLKNTNGTTPKSLNNTYFFINSALNSNQYYIWYNVGGVGVDPAIPGKIGLMVTISTGSNASQVAIATKTVLDSTNKFITNINNDTLLVTNSLIGTTNNATEETSNFLILIKKLGENRQLLVSLVMVYDVDCNILSVERL